MEVVVVAQGREDGTAFETLGTVVESDGHRALVGHEAEVEVGLVRRNLQTGCCAAGRQCLAVARNESGGSGGLPSHVFGREAIDALVVFVIVRLLHRPVAHKAVGLGTIQTVVHTIDDSILRIGRFPETHLVDSTLHIHSQMELCTSQSRNL